MKILVQRLVEHGLATQAGVRPAASRSALPTLSIGQKLPAQRRTVRTGGRRRVTARLRVAAVAGTQGGLPDVNVWLALAVQEHPHHAAARHYWAKEAAARVQFCRVMMLGLVRLLTQPRLMGSAALDATATLAHYERFAALPEVGLAAEPADTGAAMRRYVGAGLPARLITDAYLAAFAATGGLRLVTFDRDFERFDGLHLLRLPPATEVP